MMSKKWGRHPLRLAWVALFVFVIAREEPVHSDPPARPLVSAPRSNVVVPTVESGQAVTRLPDGQWLLTGGLSHPEQIAIVAGADAPVQVLSQSLYQPRSAHSASLLPDGSVLIFGGRSPDGNVLNTVEVFDPATASLTWMGSVGLSPRAAQATAVLSDSRLLILGGTDQTGGSPNPEVYDPTSREVQQLQSFGNIAGLPTKTAMLASGDVLVWADNSGGGQGIWLFDQNEARFTGLSVEQALKLLAPPDAAGPSITFSQPEGGAALPLDQPLAVRFSQPIDVSSLNATTVTLIGPSGVTPTKIVPVDEGSLLFVTPEHDLTPGANYTLFISGAATTTGQALPFSPVGFHTAAITATADSANKSESAAPQAPATAANTSPSSAKVPAALPDARAQLAGPKLTPSAPVSSPAAETSTSPPPGAKASGTSDAAQLSERWIPTAANRNGRWVSHHRALSLQTVPQNETLRRALRGHPEVIAMMKGLRPAAVAAGVLQRAVPAQVLRAAADVTAVSGQVLRLNGQPLKGVTLRMAGRSAKTDVNGEFRLVGVPAGHQVLVIDGNSANHDGSQYGRYEYGTTVVAGKDNAIPFVIWLTALDTADVASLASPTVGTTTITNPEIPGLELRIPSGTVIRDAAGKVVTRVGITAIPTDQPPFPLPNVPVPVYFTIQPGGAHLETASGQVSPGAQLIYPNFTHQRPHSRVRFWNYDAASKGWYVYGFGRVSADGTQVIPDPGVVIYEFSGAMVSDPDNAPDTNPNPCSQGGDPVDCSTGLFLNEEVDLQLADVMPIEVRRSYRQKDPVSRAFGIGTNLSYDFFLVGTSDAMGATDAIYSYQDLILPDGQRIHYPRVSPGTGYADAVYQAATTPGPFFGSTIVWGPSISPDGGFVGWYWVLTLRDGTQFQFPDSEGSSNARDAAVFKITDRDGNAIGLTRDGYSNLTDITSQNGRHIHLSYDSENRVTQATDNLGRTVAYTYDAAGHLTQVTDPDGNTEQYSYDADDNLLVVTDKRGHAKVTNTYDSNDRVVSQTYADGTSSSFSYTLDPTGASVVQADYTDRRGMITRRLFNSAGLPTQVIRGYGLPIQQSTSFVRDPNTNLVTSITDAIGRTTAFTYDALGNLTSVTRLAGTAGAVTESTQYSSDFSSPTMLTDGNGHSWQLAYGARGDVVSATDPLSHTWVISTDSEGRVATQTDPNGHTTTYSYTGADLTSITDANGNRQTVIADVGGRVIAMSNPLGATTLQSYSAAGLPTTTTDPNGATVGRTYDQNGNLTSMTDGLSHTVTYTRDAGNRVASMADPLSNTETYQYEPGGSLSQVVDRNGQVRGMTYDALGRLTQVGYGATIAHPTAFTSTISYTWDAANRLTGINDSSAGTISRSYDGLDRFTQEVTSQGTVTYTYDAGGRRTSMGVTGQPTVSYTWDDANRLTQFTQAAGTINGGLPQTVVFNYDAAGRRSQTTLSNNATLAYTYDSTGQLTGLVYVQSDTTPIGNLTYTYDSAGRRTSIGGTLANATVPTGSMGATYDADNRLTQFNGVSQTYDANGSLLADGTNTYTWNARNKLTGVSGPASASFAYDGLGRRTQRTIGGVTNQYLYDGLNYTQEQDGGGALTATVLTGGVDQVFARMTPTAISIPLTDPQGSVLAETNPSQAITTSYSYDPYGGTSVTGTSTGNSRQFAGRENDLAGLYFYRARYYAPGSGRFLSQDPLGINAGPNRYAYVGDNPISYIDPLGLNAWTEEQTWQQLAEAYLEATEGRIAGLQNIYNNSQGLGPDDYAYNDLMKDDTWTRCGRTMNADQFANYMAGFQGAAYDSYYYWTTGMFAAETAVKSAGLMFHLQGRTKAKNDPWDKTGFPDINRGEKDGWTFSLSSIPGCPCSN